MKCLILVDHAIGKSGPHRNVVGTLNALGGRGDVSVVLVTGGIDENEPYASAGNIEIRRGFHPHDPRRVLANLREVRGAARGCDVVYVPTNLKSFLYAQAVRPGRRLVAGPNVTALPIRRSDSPGFLELGLMCDLWLEASRARRDHVCSITKSDKVSLLRHSIDSDAFSPARRSAEVWRRHGVGSQSIKVIYVGRDNEPIKGVEQLIDAFDLLRRGGESCGAELILIGRMSERTLRRVQAMDNIHPVGFVAGPELSSLYASADVCVIPSSWENMSFTVLEAMASGLAIVASRTGGIPEQIEDGRSGMLVDIVGDDGRHRPDAAETLARAISSLVSDRPRREALGREARRRAVEDFSESRLGVELVAAFRGLMGGSEGLDLAG